MKKRRLIGLLLTVVMVFTLAACGNSSKGSDVGKVFPAFEGMDLDGNKVDSSIFKNNSVTVVNFWFSSCQACVEELGELNELNESLKEKGGAVIGVNTDTFGGKEETIKEAKGILEQKKAEYTNVWVPKDSELAKFTKDFFAYPVTCVVDSNGNIVGKPIMGGINSKSVMESLQKQIDGAMNQK